jgi:hypothetical protein
VTHLFKIAALTLSGLALCGTAFADSKTSFEATFSFNQSLSVEANYANFERTAARKCRVDVMEAGGVMSKRSIEADCTKRLLADAITTSGKADLIALHAQRTGTDVLVATAQ